MADTHHHDGHCCDHDHHDHAEHDPEMDAIREPAVDEEIKVTNDGGVLKKIVKKGTGYKKPAKGADVDVHYVGKLLDNTIFDSSRDRDKPFNFKLGCGNVIKGWDEGVATMLKDEIAIFTIKPEYAYGSSGQGKIPPNSTLVFEVELLNWCEEKDVSEKKDKSILMKVLKEGEGWETPSDETVCTINYSAKIKETGRIFETKENFTFTIGEETVLPGLEKAVESMKRGEVAIVTIMPQHAFGILGNSALSVAGTDVLEYEVTLVSFDKPKAPYQLAGPEQLEMAEKKRLEGNALYTQGKLARALKKYKKALECVDSDYKLSEEEKGKAKKLKVPCYLNIAACKLATKEWNEVLENCKKALDIESRNVRGLLRRGKAFSALDDWDSAERDFNEVLLIEPKNADALKELKLLKDKIARQNQRDRKAFAGLFSKMSRLEEEENIRLEKEKEAAAQLAKKEAEEKAKVASETNTTTTTTEATPATEPTPTTSSS
ncbi:peptidyl-prolyl cis-trans isomerase FKBP4 [Pelomyxa schiedti]|nr:peptidyl-prolyl cis-trans isomerase FKBP4 [Pelomyxa schiedti]